MLGASYRRAAASAALKLNFRPEQGFADPAHTTTTLETIRHQSTTFRQSARAMSAKITGETPLYNPTCLEMYLSDVEFEGTFGMDKASFYALKQWKQRQLKRRAGIF